MQESELKLLKQSNPDIPDLKGFIESKVRMHTFKHFNLEVGVDGIQFIGLPGSGKTSFAMRVCKDLMKELYENILMSGDRFCEFRHFFRYPRIVKKITMFIPDNQELYFHNIPTEEEINNRYNARGLIYQVIKINLDEFNINNYLTNETKSEVFVIYDNHYQGKYLWKRAELWKRITKQLLERTVLLDCAIATLYNEAGILWQEGASGKHWQEINDYSEIVVECRKGLVRVILLSQLETEIYHPIRKKMLWKVYRLGTTSKMAPKSVRSAAPFQSRSAYILMYGGMYRIGNQTIKIQELKETWKIIPIGEPVIEENITPSQENEAQKHFNIIIQELVDGKTDIDQKILDKYIMKATIETFLDFDISADAMSLINGLGNKRNSTLKGKANLERSKIYQKWGAAMPTI